MSSPWFLSNDSECVLTDLCPWSALSTVTVCLSLGTLARRSPRNTCMSFTPTGAGRLEEECASTHPCLSLSSWLCLPRLLSNMSPLFLPTQPLFFPNVRDDGLILAIRCMVLLSNSCICSLSLGRGFPKVVCDFFLSFVS